MKNVKIDFYALDNKDWDCLGEKINRFLPPAYSKKPEDVKIYKRRDGEVGAEMVFVSAATGSCRVVRLYQESASIFVNGCPICGCDNVKNEIEEVWNNFKLSKLALENSVM
ncbi:MAG: hypothetical protein J6J24_01060 [Clostridia bacterium]|nr:hypothetical protein [Clostridia bacterium]